jgi:HSP20 family protein
MANVTRYSQPIGVTPLSEAMNNLFRDAFTWPRLGSGFGTAMQGLGSNLYETNESYVLQVLLPGASVDQLEITAQANTLSLRGKTVIPVPEGAQGVWIGTTSGEFREEVTLPGEVDPEHASAAYQDGILTLTLPKSARTKAHTIRVNSGQQQPTIEGQKK